MKYALHIVDGKHRLHMIGQPLDLIVEVPQRHFSTQGL